jgi:hypothetical protein
MNSDGFGSREQQGKKQTRRFRSIGSNHRYKLGGNGSQ